MGAAEFDPFQQGTHFQAAAIGEQTQTDGLVSVAGAEKKHRFLHLLTYAGRHGRPGAPPMVVGRAASREGAVAASFLRPARNHWKFISLSIQTWAIKTRLATGGRNANFQPLASASRSRHLVVATCRPRRIGRRRSLRRLSVRNGAGHDRNAGLPDKVEKLTLFEPRDFGPSG